MSADTAMSFDRMRGMLNRAAEIRESEQQQVFDSLDEIHARLAALDALGTMRKRLSELPDRTEVSVLAERLDETVAKLDAQDAAVAAIMRAVEALPDKLAKPFAQLDGRLDGMAGRMEGISGRMDGLDDRLGGLHKRLDELDHRLDRHEMRLDACRRPWAPRSARRSTGSSAPCASSSTPPPAHGRERRGRPQPARRHRRRPAPPARRPRRAPGGRPDRAAGVDHARLEALATRLDTLDEGMSGRLGSLGGSLENRLAKLESEVGDRPDRATVSALSRARTPRPSSATPGSSTRRWRRSPSSSSAAAPRCSTPAPAPPDPAPHPAPKVKSSNGASAAHTELVTDDPDD